MIDKKRKTKKENSNCITKIPKCSRPREKLCKNGPASLSDLELIAIIIGSGTTKKNVLEISQDILALIKANNKYPDFKKLMEIEGIGVARAAQLTATVEFAKRLFLKDGISIKYIEDILNQVEDLRKKKQEHFVILTLDGAAKLIEKRIIFIGTLNQSLIHPREIFAEAINDRAASIVLIHNHPSGITRPSRDDIAITTRLVEAGNLLGIKIEDHIIISQAEHYSFKENKLL